MIVTSAAISKTTLCELQSALDSIDVKHTPHSYKYNTIRNYSGNLLEFRISRLLLTVVSRIAIVCSEKTDNKKSKRIIYGLMYTLIVIKNTVNV